MNGSGRLLSLVVAIPLMLSTGCIGWWGPVDLQMSISRSSGMVLSKEIGVNVGGVTLQLAAGFLGPELPFPVSDLSGVDVGVYKIRWPAHPRIRDLSPPGWERFMRVRERGEDVVAFVKRRNGVLHRMLVVVRDDDELVIVHVRGKIAALVRKCLSTYGGGVVRRSGSSPRAVGADTGDSVE